MWPVRGIFGRKGKVQPLLCAATVGVRMGEVGKVHKAQTGGGTTDNPSYVSSKDVLALDTGEGFDDDEDERLYESALLSVYLGRGVA